jgi:hypothetical protein
MKRYVMGAVIWAALAIPAGALAQDVNSDSAPGANFAGYKTYAWTPGTPAKDPFMEQRIHQGVDQRMAAKGFTLVTANPDVVVTTHASGKEQKELIASGYGGSLRFGGGMATASVNTYIQGMLALDLYDAKSKQIVWRATATDTMSDKPDKNTKKINNALDKMFKQYPPKAKS